MKKALIALSVAAGMIGAAQAENTTTLYGSLGFGTQYSHLNGSNGGVGDAAWDLNQQAAKLGVKGTEDLSNGMQAFFKFEFGVDGSSLKTRYAYLGLTGDFGTVTLGQQDSLYKVVTNYNDIFEDSFYNDQLATFETATGGSRIPKVISYVSPNFSGFQFGLAGVLDGSHEVIPGTASDKKSFDAAQAGVWYKANGFYAGLAYSWADAVMYKQNFSPVSGFSGKTTAEPGITRVIGGAFGYENDTFKAGLGVQNINARDDAGIEMKGRLYNVAGEYYLGQNTFRGGVAVADYKNDKNVYTYALGYVYNFSKRTYSWIEGQYIDAPSDWTNDGKSNGYQVKVGLRHNF